MAGMPGVPSDLARLAALADQCVMCGLCLPFCPTYAVGREEGESPRGRITLIKGLADGRMAATPALIDHLDSCLACRRCEAVCPANVRYGELIAGARALPALSARRSPWRAFLDRSLSRPRRLRALLALRPTLAVLRPWSQRRGAWAKRIRLVLALPLPEVIGVSAVDSTSRPRSVGVLPSVRDVTTASSESRGGAPPDSAGRMVASTVVAAFDDSAPTHPTRRAVLLFQGCVAGPYEVRLREGAMRLLTALGDEAVLADANLCCGSLSRFGGDATEADTREVELLDALRCAPGALVLGSATGCQSRLAAIAGRAGTTVDELQSYIAGHPSLPSLRFAPLPARVAVHQPCSQRQLGAGSAASVTRVLALIPGLVRVDLPEQDRCCGAAGSHFIARPTQSLTLRDRVLEDVVIAAPDIIVSANIGCRLMIAGGISETRRTIPVLHPIELLAQQLLT